MKHLVIPDTQIKANEVNEGSFDELFISLKYLKEKYPDGKFEHDGKTYAILIDGN